MTRPTSGQHRALYFWTTLWHTTHYVNGTLYALALSTTL